MKDKEQEEYNKWLAWNLGKLEGSFIENHEDEFNEFCKDSYEGEE